MSFQYQSWMTMVETGSLTFTLTLSNITGAIFAGGDSTLTQIITIIDDETAPDLNIATDHEFVSPGLPLTFTVSIDPQKPNLRSNDTNHCKRCYQYKFRDLTKSASCWNRRNSNCSSYDPSNFYW